MSFNCPETYLPCSGSGRIVTSIIQILVGFTQSGAPDTIPINCILLDTFSNYSVGYNLDIFGTIHNFTEDEILEVHTNGGLKAFTNIETLKLFPLDIHIIKYYMEKNLSLKDIESISGVHIKIDLPKEGAIIVERGEKIIKFKECRDGIYYHAVGSDNPNKSKNTVNNYTMVQTDKGKNHNLPNNMLKIRIDRGDSINHSMTDRKICHRVIDQSITL